MQTTARTTLDYYEMTQVRAELIGRPLRRIMLLSGPADDFQRSELVRIMESVPGVSKARWEGSRRSAPIELPLLLEVELWSLLSFGLGLLLAYLIELRRRANAEWRW